MLDTESGYNNVYQGDDKDRQQNDVVQNDGGRLVFNAIYVQTADHYVH